MSRIKKKMACMFLNVWLAWLGCEREANTPCQCRHVHMTTRRTLFLYDPAPPLPHPHRQRYRNGDAGDVTDKQEDGSPERMALAGMVANERPTHRVAMSPCAHDDTQAGLCFCTTLPPHFRTRTANNLKTRQCQNSVFC